MPTGFMPNFIALLLLFLCGAAAAASQARVEIDGKRRVLQIGRSALLNSGTEP
jgi:hypothetical protein